MALVRERTIPTERPPLVGEITLLKKEDLDKQTASSKQSETVLKTCYGYRPRYEATEN
jgi:hypothetical protein